jgi:hypothetical protein
MNSGRTIIARDVIRLHKVRRTFHVQACRIVLLGSATPNSNPNYLPQTLTRLPMSRHAELSSWDHTSAEQVRRPRRSGQWLRDRLCQVLRSVGRACVTDGLECGERCSKLGSEILDLYFTKYYQHSRQQTNRIKSLRKWIFTRVWISHMHILLRSNI